MNPQEFYGSKLEEDPLKFIDKVYKVLYIMGLLWQRSIKWPLTKSKGLLKFNSINGMRLDW